jgi:acyl-CoA reductase-like NAD-dependent aldehyde dehydrogenase
VPATAPPAPSWPFGGYRQSGIGREKGVEAPRSYTQLKNVCVKASLQ